jgi:hypothetical protein
MSPGIALISLPAHTRGHGCVALDAGHRWVMHCSDAFFHHGTVDGTVPMPRALAAFECPFPGYSGEVRLTPAGAGTHISYTVSSTASFPVVKAPFAAVCQVLLRLLARVKEEKLRPRP